MRNNLLKGKRGIIFGALDEDSIAWKVAERAVEEGAEITLTNAPVALRLGKIKELGEICNAKIIPADATNIENIENLLTQSSEILGGKIDFILHSIGMSPNVRKGRDYKNLNYDFYTKTIDISALSLHKIIQSGLKLDLLADWGSILALSYIAAQRIFPGYNDMAEAKSVLESIVRNFGYYAGKDKKIRINSISQSPTKTTAGNGISGFDKMFNYAESLSPLGNANALDCANLCIMMFSDFTKMITMQNIFNDGGFSSVGASLELLEKCSSELVPSEL
jgi:enoyl-[acyl-carrier protein] reductase I